MSSKQGLDIAPPPRKAKKDVTKVTPASSTAKAAKPVKKKAEEEVERSVSFENVAGEEKVQFNRRVSQSTADGFDMLAIKTRKKMSHLLEEALELLENKYGKS